MDFLEILILIPLIGITLIALFAALSLLLPAPVEKTRNHFENAPGRSLLLGIVNFIFFAVLTALFVWLGEQTGGLLNGIFILLGGIVIGGFAIFALFGLTALSIILGKRMGGGKTPFNSNLRGGALLLLAGLAPYLGWFIFTPLMLWAGFGAAISALMRKKDKAPSIEKSA